MSEMKKAIAYIRVSTEEQGSDDKFGVEVQQAAILKWAKQHDYSIMKIVVEKMSGAKERPLMNQIVFGDSGVDNPPYSAVIVYKNDRIARDMKLYFYYEYVLNKRGVELLCVQDDFLNGVDSSVATLYKAMMQFVAEQERKNITLRTSSGRLAKAKKGGYSGGGVPYGYRSVDHHLVVDEYESKVVKMIFDLKNSYNTADICREVNNVGYVARNGKPFSYITVRKIISNEYFYQGLYHYADIGWIKGEHEPILNERYEFTEKEEERMNREMEMEQTGEIYD